MDFDLRKAILTMKMDRKIQDVDYVEIRGQKTPPLVLWRGSDETDCWMKVSVQSDDPH